MKAETSPGTLSGSTMRTMMERRLARDGLEISDEEPGAERHEEGGVDGDERPQPIEPAQAQHDLRERDEEDGGRDEVGDVDEDARHLGPAEPDARDGERREEARRDAEDGGPDADLERVPEPARVGGLGEEIADVVERRADDAERVRAHAHQLGVRLHRREYHPVEGEEQEEREEREREICAEDAPHGQASRRSATSAAQAMTKRNGSVNPAMAAPSPSAPPGIARWYASVTKRCVALPGPPRVMVQTSWKSVKVKMAEKVER